MGNTGARLIQRVVAMIDRLLSGQLDAILHHPRFQQLEASWRALDYLIKQSAETGSNRIKVKILSVSWVELGRDVTRAVEFDQSQLFHKIYSNEFGHPGGEPFGLLVGDYHITHRPQQGQLVNDITVLQIISKIAAAAFAPFVAAAAPSLFGLDDFASLERPLNLERTFQQAEYRAWQTLRGDEDARFVGLLLPHVLLRSPYRDQLTLRQHFCFSEKTHAISDFLWGNPAFHFAAAAISVFAKSGWFSELRGEKLPNLATKYLTAIRITNRQEKILNDFGFIAISTCQYTGLNTIYSCASIQKAKHYDNENATQSARISSMLHYVMCVSRFAHYIKVIARDKTGMLVTAKQYEDFIQQWLHQYTAANPEMSMELKAKYPLREAKVQVQEKLGSAGSYFSTLYLSPHYQFDQVESYLKLRTELVRGS